jgi:hypothetical protein
VAELKRYSLGPEHRIRLFDLLTRTTEKTLQGISDVGFDPNVMEQGDALLERLQDYVESCRLLMHLLFTGCYFGTQEHEELWTTAVQRIADSYNLTGGYPKMLELQRVPALLVMSAAAFGAILGKRYRNLVSVTIRPILRRQNLKNTALVETITPSLVIERDLLRAAKRFERHITPASELMFEYLHELGRTVLVTDSEYMEAFDRFEIILALLTIDAGGWAVGCFAWRGGVLGQRRQDGPLDRVRQEIESEGVRWEPLDLGLFGGRPERVKGVLERLTQIAERTVIT